MLIITFLFIGEFVSTTNDERVAWTHTGGNLGQYPWSNALDDNKYTSWFAAGTIAQRRANPDQKPDTVTATFKERSLFSLTFKSSENHCFDFISSVIYY